MPNNSDFDKIIPGISLVPDIELHDFFQTEEGNNIESILNNFYAITKDNNEHRAPGRF